MDVLRVNGLSYPEFVRRERRVSMAFSAARQVYRVRIERRDGDVTEKEFTALQLQASRLTPYELVALAFRDPIDRAAVRFLGPDAFARVTSLDAHAGDSEAGGGTSLARERGRQDGAYWGARSSRVARRSPRGVEKPPSDAPGVLAPPSSRLPMYRPR